MMGCSSSSPSSSVPVPPVASLSASSLTFANTAVGSTATPQVLTLSNTGTTTLNITGISITGADAADFAETNTCGNTLAVSSNCTIAVTFTPVSAKTFAASISVADNATSSPQTATLNGTGTIVSLSFGNLTFPTTSIGTTAAAQTLTLANTGTAAISITSISIGGTNPTNFAETNTCGNTLAGGASCIISVTFTASSIATVTASLSVIDTAVGSPQTATLVGLGVEPNNCKATDTTSPAQPTPTTNYPGSAFSGKVMAGQAPVIGASVQVYAAGRTGNGSAPTAMLPVPLVTDVNGAFSVPASFTCPYSNSILYAVARGGKAGTSGTVNSGIVLATILGQCNSLTGSPSFVINEATTVATALAMQPFLSTGGNIGATSTNSSGIVLAAATVANLVNTTTGSAPGAYFPATGTAPTARINSLANLLNACVASTGASSTSCTSLYAATKVSTTVPINTLDAAMNLVRQPGANVATLYTLSQASAAYSPALTTAPQDWTVFVTYTGGGMSDPSALSIDSTGKVWVANYFGVGSLFTNTGSPVFASGITGNNLGSSYGGAVDVNDVEWIANEEGGGGIGSITLLNNTGASPAVYTSGGLDFPISVAFDTSGVAWVVDYGNSSLTLLNNAGSPLSGASGYTAKNFVFPVAVAVNSKCNGYIANSSSNTITKVFADGSNFADFNVGSGPTAIAVDGSDNAWVANYYGNSIGLVTAAGSVLSGTGGYTGSGLNHPQGIAIDGAGTAWIANYRASDITELAGANAATPGAPLSPANGLAGDSGLIEAFGLAIDAAGNVWVTSFGTNTLVEFVGLAAPVKTPLLGPVRVP